MPTPKQKITLNASRDIPFNKLMLSQSNVRRIKRGETIEDLAASIARRGLLQSLNVRPVLDGEGNETGMFEVPAGGRRYRALELLVKQKRVVKTEPVPCVVTNANSEVPIEEDSLAENFQREDRKAVREFSKSNAILDPYRALPAMVVKSNKRVLRRVPDRAILRLASALARQAAREDHARQQAEKTHHESSRDLCTLLNRSPE